MTLQPASAPSPARQLANFVVLEGGWFACILGVAHGRPLWGTAAVGAAIARWHVGGAMPPVMALSDRLDGVAGPRPGKTSHA